MSRTVSFTCNDSALPVITGVLKQLALVTDEGAKRVIRIGGDEKKYDGDVDSISDIMVDGILDTSPYVPSIPDRKKKAAPISTNTVASSDSDSDSDDTDSDSDSGSVVVSDGSDSLDDANRGIVEDIVVEMIDAGRLFTAFDITKEAKSRGATQRHRLLKNAVHDMHAQDRMPNYNRGLIQIDGVSVNPFVYYPDGTDPEDYFLVNSNVTGSAV